MRKFICDRCQEEVGENRLKKVSVDQIVKKPEGEEQTTSGGWQRVVNFDLCIPCKNCLDEEIRKTTLTFFELTDYKRTAKDSPYWAVERQLLGKKKKEGH